MKTIKIGDKEYTLEFTYEAADCKDHVQNMFNVMSGAYIVRRAGTEDVQESDAMRAVIDGSAEMVADIPRICRIAFYAGMLEQNEVSMDEAKELMKQYMRETKLSFYRLFEDLKKWMEDDGFFDMSGLNEMIQSMSMAAEKKAQEQTEDQKETKAPTKKKSTSTK